MVNDPTDDVSSSYRRPHAGEGPQHLQLLVVHLSAPTQLQPPPLPQHLQLLVAQLEAPVQLQPRRPPRYRVRTA